MKKPNIIVRFFRGIKEFVDPSLKAGRVPFTRTVLVLELAAALVFVGYTLVKKDYQFPWSPEPYYVEVILPDAKGLVPSKEPGAGVAGAFAGKVVEVEEEHGRALVTLRLDADYEGKIFKDATAEVRPTSVLQTLIVNVLPGDPATGPLEEGTPIEPANTTAFVHIDELTSVLDADTQAQAQILIREAATALRGREPELRRILLEVGRVAEGATPVAAALAKRRRLLTKLVDDLDKVFATLGLRGRQLAAALDLANQTLSVTAAREPELSDTTREFAPTLVEAQRALAATRSFAVPLGSALASLNPAVPQLEPFANSLVTLAPEADDYLGLTENLVADASEPVGQLSAGLRGQAERVRDEQIPALDELIDLIDLIIKYRGGLVQFGDNFSGIFSSRSNYDGFAQAALVNTEILPEGLGLNAAAAASKDGEPSRLAVMLSKALELTCRDTNPLACLLRLNLPGLPNDPLLNRGQGSGN